MSHYSTMVPRRDLFRFLFLFCLALVGLMLILLIPDCIQGHIIIVFLTAGVSVLCVGCKFDHPLCWFPLFFCLYNCAYWILILINPYDELAVGYSGDNAFLVMSALSVTLVFLATPKRQFRFQAAGTISDFDKEICDLLLFVFEAGLMLCIGILLMQGVSSKQEQWASRNMAWILATYFTRFIVFIVAYYVFRLNFKKENSLIKIAFAGISIACFSLITGERDALVRFLIVILVALSMTGKIQTRHLFFLAPLGVAIMICSAYFKYFFSTGSLNSNIFSTGSLLYAFLYSDFSSCGSNLQVVLNHTEVEGILNGVTIVLEFLSGIVPSSMMNALFGTDWAVSEWFNNYFFPGSSWSRAFSLVAEGYVIGGVAGVIVLFALIGIMIRKLYILSWKGPWQAAIYVYGVASMVASFRGDLASFFQAFLRIPVFLFLCIWISKHLLLFLRKGRFCYHEK